MNGTTTGWPELSAIDLYTRRGQRKYLTPEERQRFFAATCRITPIRRLCCQTLHFTGCRLSEVLSLTQAHIDCNERQLVIPTLKQRRKHVFRAIPVPDSRQFHQRVAGDHAWARRTAICAEPYYRLATGAAGDGLPPFQAHMPRLVGCVTGLPLVPSLPGCLSRWCRIGWGIVA